MKEFVVSDFAALVGIDWADKKHRLFRTPTKLSIPNPTKITKPYRSPTHKKADERRLLRQDLYY